MIISGENGVDKQKFSKEICRKTKGTITSQTCRDKHRAGKNKRGEEGVAMGWRTHLAREEFTREESLKRKRRGGKFRRPWGGTNDSKSSNGQGIKRC